MEVEYGVAVEEDASFLMQNIRAVETGHWTISTAGHGCFWWTRCLQWVLQNANWVKPLAAEKFCLPVVPAEREVVALALLVMLMGGGKLYWNPSYRREAVSMGGKGLDDGCGGFDDIDERVWLVAVWRSCGRCIFPVE